VFLPFNVSNQTFYCTRCTQSVEWINGIRLCDVTSRKHSYLAILPDKPTYRTLTNLKAELLKFDFLGAKKNDIIYKNKHLW